MENRLNHITSGQRASSVRTIRSTGQPGGSSLGGSDRFCLAASAAKEGTAAMWSALARLANRLWWVWLPATLAVLAYFAGLALDILQ